MSDGMRREVEVPITDDDLLTDVHVNALLGELLPMQRTALTRHMMAKERQVARETETRTARHLENLLAVIHRDGGHYVGRHGLDKAVADATEIIINERATLGSLKGT